MAKAVEISEAQLWKHVPIFMDSQGVLRGMACPILRSKYHCTSQVAKETESLIEMSYCFQLQWVPGHNGVPSNKIADYYASKENCAIDHSLFKFFGDVQI